MSETKYTVTDARPPLSDFPYHCADHGWWSAKKESGCPTCVLEARKQIRTLELECTRLHTRLEDNFGFNGKGNRIVIKPGIIPDGIECRDETIKQLDKKCARLEQEKAELVAACREALKPIDYDCGNVEQMSLRDKLRAALAKVQP